MLELLRRLRLPVVDRAFLDEVNIHAERPQQHRILEVAVKPVRLLDEDRLALPRLPQERDHLPERRPTRLLGRFNVLKDPQHRKATVAGMLFQELALGRYGIAL